MIDAVLFDLGDTIINFGKLDQDSLFEQGARETYKHLRDCGNNLPSFETYFKLHRKAIKRAYLLSKVKRREFNVMHIITEVLAKMDCALNEGDLRNLAWLWYLPIVKISHVTPGTHDMLAHLRDSGLKLTIVSNTFIPGHCLDRQLADENLLDFFPIRIYSSDVKYQKPHPKIFKIALNQTHVKPSHAVFIGDLLKADIKGGRKAGMKTIWKPALHLPPKKGKKHKADAQINSILMLPDTLRELGWKPKNAIS